MKIPSIKEIKLKQIPPIAAAIIIFIGTIVFWGNAALVGNVIILGVLVGTLPYILLSYLEYQQVRAIEEQLPAFLLDLSEAAKTGLSLPEALKTVGRTDYGKLSIELKKINDQISWGIPVQEALDKFSKRMYKSDMVRRVMRIINEAYNSGGDIVRTMESTAADIVAIREAEKDRKTITYQHVMVMYAIYFIFIGIVIGLSRTLIPMLQLNAQTSALGGILSFQDPCATCSLSSNFFCISCTTFLGTCQLFFLGSGTTCYYRALFLLMVIVQGIFSGLVAGQIGENSVLAGFKHSVIMTSVGFATLLILLQVGWF